MARTLINPADQIPAASLTRAMHNTATAGLATITKAIAGAGIVLSSTGADAGTGDVTISISSNGGLTAVVTIASTTSPTTSGVTLAGQTLVAGSSWKIRANGTYTAVSSATARNARYTATWGGTGLLSHAIAVAINTAITTNWNLEIDITASSTTAAWMVTSFFNNLAAGTAAAPILSVVAPASTASLPAGSQMLDIKFSMSAVVAGDAWNISNVTIQRVA